MQVSCTSQTPQGVRLVGAMRLLLAPRVGVWDRLMPLLPFMLNSRILRETSLPVSVTPLFMMINRRWTQLAWRWDLCRLLYLPHRQSALQTMAITDQQAS